VNDRQCALSVNNLLCIRQEHVLFANLSFDLAWGNLLQVIGPNGCGKTSLLQILCGLLTPNQGTLQGCDKNTLIYVGHKLGVKDNLTVGENLRLSQLNTRKKNARSITEACGLMKLTDLKDEFCRDLSMGQKKRVAIARLILSDVPLWILDEPFASLDNEGAEVLSDLISKHILKGGVAVLASHQVIPLKDVPMQQLHLEEQAKRNT